MLFTSSFAHAQAKADTVLENALLWEISGNGLQSPSYLFGTYHFLCKDEIVLPEILKEKILSCDRIYFEIETTGKDSLPSGNPDKNNLTKTGSIKARIGAENFSKAISIISQRFKFSSDTLDHLNTTAFVMLLTRASLGCDVNSIDYKIAAFADSNHKKTKALETNEEHWAAMIELTRTMGQQIEKDYWNDLETNLLMQKEDIQFYKEKNITMLYLQNEKTSNETYNLHQKIILYERNKNWLPEITRAIDRKSCLFAFGCAHLVGAKGVIGLLRAKGYVVKPVEY